MNSGHIYHAFRVREERLIKDLDRMKRAEKLRQDRPSLGGLSLPRPSAVNNRGRVWTFA